MNNDPSDNQEPVNNQPQPAAPNPVTAPTHSSPTSVEAKDQHPNDAPTPNDHYEHRLKESPTIVSGDLEQHAQSLSQTDVKHGDDEEIDSYPPPKPSCGKRTCNAIKSVLPIVDWISNYSWQSLRYDVVAGVTVGIMAIPQGMAYALLADLPPIYGLYACIMPVFAYGVLGTSKCAHIGPFALVSMLVYSTVSPYVNSQENMDEYISAVLCLSFMVGCLLTLLGVCQLGIVTSLLSETVITAFTSTSAFNIGGSQLKHYLDATVTKSNFLGVLTQLFSSENIAKYNYCQLILGVTATILLYVMKQLNSKYLKKVPLPNELFLVIIYILISWGFDLKGKYGIGILGDQEIPSGFPPFTVPSFEHFVDLIPGCIVVAVVAFVITFSLGKIFARKDNYKINSNQELIALGLSNVLGSFLSSYPAAGSLSRTALIYNLKSRTQFHNFVSPLIIIFCLYLLTDFIKYLPKSTLAAVVEINLISLFKQLGEIANCWKVDICDFLTFLCCGIVNITVGTTEGLITGVVVSLVCLIIKIIVVRYKKAAPVVFEHPNLDNKKYLEYNVDLCFMFLNRDFIEAKIEKILARNPKITILVNMEHVKYIDMSGFITIESLLKNKKNVYFAIYDPEVNKHMKAYGLLKENQAKEDKRIFRTMKELYKHLIDQPLPVIKVNA